MAFLVQSRCMKCLSDAKLSNISNDTSSLNMKSLKNKGNSGAPKKSSSCCDFEYFNILFLVMNIILEVSLKVFLLFLSLIYVCNLEQAMASTLYYFAYGYMAMATNIFAWVSLLYVILLFSAIRLKREDFKKWLW